MTEMRYDTCPECDTERHVRLDGTFRLHGAGIGGSALRTCPGSHKPAPRLTAVQYMSDAERLRQIRALCSKARDAQVNLSVSQIQRILDT